MYYDTDGSDTISQFTPFISDLTWGNNFTVLLWKSFSISPKLNTHTQTHTHTNTNTRTHTLVVKFVVMLKNIFYEYNEKILQL